jgi:hypothetical protein
MRTRLRRWREGWVIIGRFMVTFDLDRFERDSGEFRARYGIGQD